MCYADTPLVVVGCVDSSFDDAVSEPFMSREERDYSRELIPRPDPTHLTTQALDREVARLERRMDERVAALRDHHEHDMAALVLRFELIERQRVELKSDSAKNIEQTLESSKEALSSLATTYHTGHAVLTDALDEVKLRVTVMESLKLGAKELSTTTLAVAGLLLTMVYLMISVATTMIAHH